MKTVRICCYALGIISLIAAVILVLHNVMEDKNSGEQAVSVLTALKEEISEYETNTSEIPETAENDLFAEYEEPKIPEMETIEINGNLYIGYISIPDLNVELPVMSEWSYPSLKISPCRYMGNLYADDLIICAHNYNSHFGKIKELPMGSELIFTDVSGKSHHFIVTNSEQLSGTEIEHMQFDNTNDWDLTLFTCTIGGQSRVTVRAERSEDQNA